MILKKDAFIDLLQENPVIAAVKDNEGLDKALESTCNVVFVLFGNVLSISSIAEKAKSAGKACLLHMDLIDGLATREVSVDFVAQHTCANGILSTKQNLIKRAAVCDLLAVQRFFLLDSLAISNIEKQYKEKSACAIELLPGLMPKVIKRVAGSIHEPIIAGGLISDKEDVMNALGAGACAVSSTNPDVWFL